MTSINVIEIIDCILAFTGIITWSVWIYSNRHYWRYAVAPITMLANCLLFYLSAYYHWVDIYTLNTWSLVIHTQFIITTLGLGMVLLGYKKNWI